MKKIVALTAAALLSASSVAYAAMADWSSADKDGDGKVTESEFSEANPAADAQFASLDIDSSGDLSAEEYQAAAGVTGSTGASGGASGSTGSSGSNQ